MQVKGTEWKFGLIFFLNKEKKFIINGLLGRLFVCVDFAKLFVILIMVLLTLGKKDSKQGL